ncbi:DUF5683 domain-containing protein [Emticicia sp.]|uniref:DUF5683 domain-containing protein n=1 Tax=Emticicia sp. TaxID=1930953 RepID=UPI003750492D
MVRILALLLFISTVSFAQKIDSLGRYSDGRTLELIEANKKAVVDSVKKLGLRKIIRLKKMIFSDYTQKGNIPRKALLRSLILPGWGQATNKQYWIIPIIYAAAGGGIFAIKFNNDKYKFYKGYLENFVIDGAKEVTINGRGPFTQAQVEPAVKAYHRQRDLSYIGMALGWTLQAVQANVSAHLKGFDMSDNISLKFEPNIQSTSFGNAVGVKIGLNF